EPPPRLAGPVARDQVVFGPRWCAAVRARPCGVMQALRGVRTKMLRCEAERGSASGVDPLPRLGLDRQLDPPGVDRLGLVLADFSVELLALRDVRVLHAAS